MVADAYWSKGYHSSCASDVGIDYGSFPDLEVDSCCTDSYPSASKGGAILGVSLQLVAV